MNFHKERKLQKRLIKIRRLLDEMSELLPKDILVLNALCHVHEAISKFSGQMIEYHTRRENN